MKRIMSVGGGTVGHISPILAVAEELLKQSPGVELSYVGPRGDVNAHVIADSGLKFRMFAVSAGKFRRYHDRGVIRHALDLHTNWLNFIDLFKIIFGFLESFLLLIWHRPSVIFAKGGYVVVPLCTAARVLRIPYITHDSDAVAGLANRLIAGGARLNAVARADVNVYPAQKTLVTGIPLKKEFAARSGVSPEKYKQKLGFRADCLLVLVVTGTQGSLKIDNVVEPLVSKLLSDYPRLEFVHVFGRLNEQTINERYKDVPKNVIDRLHVKAFIDNAYDWIAAADVIIARAGATFIAEFAAIGRAVIVVPADALTGGQQIKNAEYLSSEGSAVIIRESELNNLLNKELRALLDSPAQRSALARSLHTQVPSNASVILAQTLLSIARGLDKS